MAVVFTRVSAEHEIEVLDLSPHDARGYSL
jgi:hypothetical protein